MRPRYELDTDAAIGAMAEVDALRARVRTLEGALSKVIEVACRTVGGNTPEDLPEPANRDGEELHDIATAALSGAQPDTALDSTKSQLDEMRPGPEELARFWDEWALKDGNSPGYNNQKAKNYGAQANAFRLRAESAELALAEREASIAELRRALEKCAEVERQAVNDRPWTIHDFDGYADLRKNEEVRLAWNAAFAALAQPAPQAALRAMLLTAANVGYQDGEAHSSRSPAEVADTVMKGES